MSVHSVSLVFHKPLLEEHTIFGTEATLQMRVEGLWSYTSLTPFDMKLYRRERMVEDVTPKILDNIDDTLTRTNHFLKEMEHFCDCIVNGRTPVITGEDGRRATEISNAATCHRGKSGRSRSRCANLPIWRLSSTNCWIRDIRPFRLNYYDIDVLIISSSFPVR